MRITVLCFILAISAVSVATTQTPKADSETNLTCEPSVFFSNPVSLHDIRDDQQTQGFTKWLMNKVGDVSQICIKWLNRGKKYLSKKITSFMSNDSGPVWLKAAKYMTKEKEESSGLSAGVWAVITFIIALFSIAAAPGFGLLVLLTSFILAMIGTVRDKDGLAILILVLSGLTFLFVLVLAMFEALLAITFFGL